MKHWISLLAALLLSANVFAQEVCGNGLDDDNDGLIDCFDADCNSASVPILSTFNTGTNGVGGVLPSGSADAGWQISVSGMAGPYVPCTVLGAPATNPYVVSPWPDAQWVSGNIDANDDQAALSMWQGEQGYIYHYRFQFALPCTDSCYGSVPDNYCLKMDFFADNAVMGIYVNGVLQPNTPNMSPPNPGAYYGFHAVNAATITLCDDWQAGLNTLTVVTLSGGGLQGFLAQVNPDFIPINAPNQSITTANDTVCLGGSLQLAANPSGGTWAASCGTCVSSAGLFTPGSVGNHYITYARPNMPNCSKDTVWMRVVAPPTVQAGNNQTVCSGQPVTLTAGGATTYTWNHSVSNGVAFTPADTGTYIVIGKNTYGCSDTDTVTINVIPAYSDSIQVQMCPHNTYTFLGHTYQQAGNYVLTFEGENGCDSSITLMLSYYPQPVAGFVMPTDVSLTNPTVSVTDISQWANAWDYYINGTWMANSPNYTFTPTQEGLYAVTQVVHNSHCVDSITQLLNVTRLPEVFIPNSFTPNRDGYNNEWKPILTYIEKYRLRIYSRWGELLFETDDLYRGWNGGWFNDLQKPVELGVYVYRIDYTEYRGKNKEIIGHITLVR